MIARRAIKSFLGVQGAIFQKSPLAAGGKKENERCQVNYLHPETYEK
jgi:hypothetical protein